MNDCLKERDNKIPIAFILTLGGHTFEALALIDKLEKHVKPSYLITNDNFIAKNKIRFHGPVCEIRPSFKAVKTKNLFYLILDAINFFGVLFRAIGFLKKSHIVAIVSMGSGASFAPIIAAKILKKKVIYVESACRVKSRSMCGNIVYKYFADMFLVQWEEQLNVYPEAIYAGRPF